MKTIKAKVHMLPTEDSMSSPFYVDKHNNIYEWGEDLKASGTPQHLYITTDEEIKEGDWYLATIISHNGEEIKPLQWSVGSKPCAEQPLGVKIIATTDDLVTGKVHIGILAGTTDGFTETYVSKIPQDFIEEYCKAGGIDKVLVEYTACDRCNVVDVACGKVDCRATRNGYPKLNQDGTLDVSLVEEKMYSREEVVSLMEDAYDTGYENCQYDNSLTCTARKKKFEDLIKENL